MNTAPSWALLFPGTTARDRFDRFTFRPGPAGQTTTATLVLIGLTPLSPRPGLSMRSRRIMGMPSSIRHAAPRLLPLRHVRLTAFLPAAPPLRGRGARREFPEAGSVDSRRISATTLALAGWRTRPAGEKSHRANRKVFVQDREETP